MYFHRIRGYVLGGRLFSISSALLRGYLRANCLQLCLDISDFLSDSGEFGFILFHQHC